MSRTRLRADTTKDQIAKLRSRLKIVLAKKAEIEADLRNLERGEDLAPEEITLLQKLRKEVENFTLLERDSDD